MGPGQTHNHRELMEAEDVLNKKLCRLLGRGQHWEAYEVRHFAESIHGRKYGGVASGAGQAVDEVHRDVRPGAAGYRQGLKEACWSSTNASWHCGSISAPLW